MTAIAPVFISYSRRDYYFAESLAFHLEALGVRAWLDVKDLQPGADWNACLEAALDAATVVILVASPDSLASANVRSEWTRARAAGKRIVVARFRGRALPPELVGVEVIDFRGVFGPARDRLAATLRSTSPAAQSVVARSPWLPFPPWVCAIGTCLGILCLFPLFLANYGDVSDAAGSTGDRLEGLVGVAVVIVLFVWFAWLSFFRRRMSSRHLALTFAFFAGVTAYPLAQYLFAGVVPPVYSEVTMRVVREMTFIPEFMLALAIGGLAVVGVVQPEDLLRWTPTGGAWRRLRVAQARRLEGRVTAIGDRFAALREFHVLHDVVDRAAGERLRDELLATGAKETSAGRVVLLLTNRTRTSWVQQESARYADRLFTVVGTGIGLPSTLDWLWKRQWLDFRSWSVDEVERHRGLPDVPESLTGLHLPASVNRFHHVICALAAVMLAVAGAVMPTDRDLELGTFNGLLVLVVGIVSYGWAYSGRRLVRRTMSETWVRRWFWITVFAGGISGFVALVVSVDRGGSVWRTLPCGIFLIAAPAWLWMRRATIAFWWPGNARRDPDALTPARNWRTFVLVSLYALLWFFILNPESAK